MAAPVPEDFLERRRILHARGGEARVVAAAKEFLKAGRLAEALEFLERAREVPLLEDVRRRAVDAGDALALRRSCAILGTEPSPDEWRSLARSAERRERWYDAVNALERAGDAEKSEALRAERCPDYRPFRPANK